VSWTHYRRSRSVDVHADALDLAAEVGILHGAKLEVIPWVSHLARSSA
jgi:hypothetical protein